jgi:hypothetical protein
MKRIDYIVADVLTALGYKNVFVENDENYFTVKFPAFQHRSNDYMLENDRKIVMIICEDHEIEFYYQNDTQFIYIFKKGKP